VDPALESVIRTILQQPTDDLMPGDLVAVTQIEADRLDIHSLEGIQSIALLQRMEILNFLWLDRDQITNIAPVAGCWRLNHLFMVDNQISDLAPLVTMEFVANLPWPAIRSRRARSTSRSRRCGPEVSSCTNRRIPCVPAHGSRNRGALRRRKRPFPTCNLNFGKSVVQ